MVKLQESKGRYSVSVPGEIARLKQWHKGQEFVWLAAEDGSVRLKEVQAKG